MEKITFECEVITPMFLAGADGVTPELRAPSIKGALRFWWRALNGDLGLEELKRREGILFGDTGKRSQVIVRVLKQPESTRKNEELLPHKSQHNHRSPRECYPEDETFSVQIMMPLSIRLNEGLFFTSEMMKSLFLVASYLGGLGKRSRRGCGSFKVTSINGEKHENKIRRQEIINLIQKINPNFSLSASSNYPVIKEIEIGSSTKNIYDIGLATHNEKINSPSKIITNKYGKKITIHPKYNATIGAGNPRFASPICISILPDGKPIITTLSTISPQPNDVTDSIQTSLKKRIL